MHKSFDVVVLGLGANGSSALYHLSKTGLKVLGIDQFKPPHTHGSSHGQSRIIRLAYHEHPLYVPLVKEAYSLWHEIERTSGKKLFLKTGAVMLGAKHSRVVTGAKLSASTHDVLFDFLDNSSIEKRFPALQPSVDTVGILEKEAGILFPEECIKTYLEEAQKNGASIQYNEAVLKMVPADKVVAIVTNKTTYITSKLIVSAGAWLGQLMPDLQLPLTVERQVLYWIKDRNEKSKEYFLPANLPVYIWEYLPGKIFYGFPDLGEGLKIAFDHGGESITPDTLTPAVSQDEINSIMEIAATYLNIQPHFNYSATCMYTNTPDKNFIIDFHPQHKNIIIASPCSGHGFKFSSLAGKILCDMAMGKSIEADLSPFRISRFL